MRKVQWRPCESSSDCTFSKQHRPLIISPPCLGMMPRCFPNTSCSACLRKALSFRVHLKSPMSLKNDEMLMMSCCTRTSASFSISWFQSVQPSTYELCSLTFLFDRISIFLLYVCLTPLNNRASLWLGCSCYYWPEAAESLLDVGMKLRNVCAWPISSYRVQKQLTGQSIHCWDLCATNFDILAT